MPPAERPLALGEILAETVRFYGERFWAALGVGAIVAGAFVVALLVPEALGIAILVVALTVVYGATVRLVSGDTFGEAWAQVALRLPVLLILGLAVTVPFALAARYLLLLVVAAAWLGLVGFAIPVAMLERESEPAGWFWRIGYALRRSLTLARAEYLHALGVTITLIFIYVLVGTLLANTLVGFAENSGWAALTLVQVVFAPFFFIGLSVLYFEQKARAVSSRRTDDRRR
ncbi:MAG TPA: hypothetical protein VG079_07245 [Gaiellaceae bacterium]|nr:hypothetical protein [Gaiellaceae bacterium]